MNWRTIVHNPDVVYYFDSSQNTLSTILDHLSPNAKIKILLNFFRKTNSDCKEKSEASHHWGLKN